MKKTGVIESLNISPKGMPEGFLLKTGKEILQVNVPKDMAGIASFRAGETVAVDVAVEDPHGSPEHKVFRLIGLKAEKPSAYKFSSIAKTLNYALHGEVNGAILKTGDFLHLKPEGARAVQLTAGMTVKGFGSTKPMFDGHVVIEAEEVNGVKIHHKGPKKHGPKHRSKHAH